jgi:hypothetical protein
MSMTVIHVWVRTPGDRADELLASLAGFLHQARLAPTEPGLIPIVLPLDQDAAYELVHRGLEIAGADWPDHLRLGRRGAV